jgi:hypothetical protein
MCFSRRWACTRCRSGRQVENLMYAMFCHPIDVYFRLFVPSSLVSLFLELHRDILSLLSDPFGAPIMCRYPGFEIFSTIVHAQRCPGVLSRQAVPFTVSANKISAKQQNVFAFPFFVLSFPVTTVSPSETKYFYVLLQSEPMCLPKTSMLPSWAFPM